MILSVGMLRVSPDFESKIHNWAKKPSKNARKWQKASESVKKVTFAVLSGDYFVVIA